MLWYLIRVFNIYSDIHLHKMLIKNVSFIFFAIRYIKCVSLVLSSFSFTRFTHCRLAHCLLYYKLKIHFLFFHFQVANILTPLAKDRPPKNDESPAQHSQTIKSTSWRNAFCIKNTCHPPTETRSRSSWVWPTRRSSPGSRTDGPSLKEISRRWKRTWSRSRKSHRRHCKNWCPWRTSTTLTVALGPFRPVFPREPFHSRRPHREAKPQTSFRRRTRKLRWTIKKTGPRFQNRAFFTTFCTDVWTAEELEMQGTISVSLILNLLKGL